MSYERGPSIESDVAMVSKFWPKMINTKQRQDEDDQQPTLSIQLLEPVVYIHSGNHPVLRGVIDITSFRPIAISSLVLGFKGNLDYRLSKLDISGQKEFAQSSLPLYQSSSSKPLIIHHSPGAPPSRFVFEMPLPHQSQNHDQQGLIQSIRCNEFQVKYHIRAKLEYQPQSTKEKDGEELMTIIKSRPQPIVILQLPTHNDDSTFYTSDNMLASIDSRKQTNHWCQYRVHIDKRFAALSSMLTVSIGIAPLIQGLKLRQASMHIVQRFTIITNRRQTFSRPPIPLECLFQSTPYPSTSSTTGTGLYEGEFRYKIPSSSSQHSIGLVPSNRSNLVNVEHHLVIHLTVTYPKVSHDGILRRARRVLTFQSEFELLHPFMADPDELLRLPAYHDDIPASSTSNRLAKEFLHTWPPPDYHQAVSPTVI
ncbi:hypothetical protein BC941DRAFT_452698 [Chlamydoabsidia padenii]|nr:hypothetical protein BC941DRAFT_452698 [Chlamydoabsidia padenii]